MKKMPCLFVRHFEGQRVTEMTRTVTTGCEWVLEGVGTASVKWDGTACLIEGGALFKRYDFKARVREKGGDWIIRGVKGELYPCKPDIFAATYNAAEDGSDAIPRT